MVPKHLCFISISSIPSTLTSTKHDAKWTCTARSSRKPKRKQPNSRRPRSSQSSERRRPLTINDPLLNDNDIDTTDITTFVSCPVCYNSLMIRPEQLYKEPLLVQCNCCSRTSQARLEKLENLDGTFNHKQWIIEFNTNNLSHDDIQQLQQFAAPPPTPNDTSSSQEPAPPAPPLV